MTMAAVFLLLFVGGPLLFQFMTRHVPTRQGLRNLAMIVAVLILASVSLRYGVAGQWGQNVALTALGIFLMWLAWIGALVFGALVLRWADTGRAMRRWTGIIGTLGTTVPWFGLAIAKIAGAQ